jgi:Mg-chelatase subunit ChlD
MLLPAAALALVLASAGPAGAADLVPVAEYLQAREAFLKDSADSRPETRARVADGLAAAYPEAAEAEACDLLVRLMGRELARPRETDIGQGVLEACVRGLRRARGGRTVDALVRLASRADLPWRMRLYLVRALGALREPKVIAAVSRIAEEKPPALRAAALDALGELGAAETVPVVARGLAAPEWELKVAAAAALRQIGDASALGPLVLALRDPGENPGRVLNEVTGALQAITGEAFGYDAAAWVKYWMRRARETGTAGDPAALPVALSATDVDTVQLPRWTTAFFGIPTPSTRIVFVIDVSGSMRDPAVPDPDRPAAADRPHVSTGRPRVVSGPGREPPAVEAARAAVEARRAAWAARVPVTRLEQAQQELVLAILDMDPRVHFSMVCFGGERTEIWSDRLLAATPPNQLKAVEAVEKLRADGATNTMDGLHIAFGFLGREPVKGQPPAPVALDAKRKVDEPAVLLRLNGADTVFLLTDGKPNRGAVPEPPRILDEVRKINEVRRVRIHVVGVGESDRGVDPPDPEWCRRLAEENGGTYRNLIRTRAVATALATP